MCVDLTSLFDWNTKQLFLYLSAEYTNAQGVRPVALESIETTEYQILYR